GTGLSDWPVELRAEGLTHGRVGSIAYHVLIGAADVGRDDLEDGCVGRSRRNLQPFIHLLRDLQLGEVDLLDGGFSGALIKNDSVFCHEYSSIFRRPLDPSPVIPAGTVGGCNAVSCISLSRGC